MLLTSIAASVAGLLFLGSAGSLWMLFLARIWSGIATSNLAVAQAYIADVTRPEDRARGMGLIGAGIGLGFVFGPVLGGLLEGYSQDHGLFARVGALPAFAAAALAALNLVLALLFLPESLPPEARRSAQAPANAAPSRFGSPFDPERYRLALRAPGTGLALLLNFVLVLSFAAGAVAWYLLVSTLGLFYLYRGFLFFALPAVMIAIGAYDLFKLQRRVRGKLRVARRNAARAPTWALPVVVFGLTQALIVTNESLAALLQASTKVGKLAVANVAAKLVWGVGVVAVVGVVVGVGVGVVLDGDGDGDECPRVMSPR